MKDILSKKIWIKDYSRIQILLLFAILLLLAYCIPLKSNSETTILIGVEQAFFVILSAILLVFHDSVIGSASILKLKEKITKLSDDSVKIKILQHLNFTGQEANYDEFLTTINNDLADFTKESEKFKKNSYRLYVIFSTLGLIAIVFSLISSNLIFDKFLMDLCIYTQIFLILIWVVSAFQAEEQKNKMFTYASIKEITEHIKSYLTAKDQKEIEFSMDY